MQLQEFIALATSIEYTPAQSVPTLMATIRGALDSFPQMDLNFALYRLSEHIIKLNSIEEHLRGLLEDCLKEVIYRAIMSDFRIGSFALRQIFDTSLAYYRHSQIDMNMNFPLGPTRKLKFYTPEVGEECDVVKPYITSTSYCSWTRCTLLAVQNKKWTVKYINTEAPIVLKEMPFFDLLGTRTYDYEWRCNLEIGSKVDAFCKVWYPATVVELGQENGAKRARISYRVFHQNGERIDAEGNRYDGLGPNQDQWIDLFSVRIQKPGKMAKKLCYYSQNADEYVLDDSYDLIFEKQYEQQPFWGLMRLSFTRSVSFLGLFEYFCNCGGYDAFLRAVKIKDLNPDIIPHMMIVIANTSFLVPRMGVNRYLPSILTASIQYLKQNHKNLNPARLDMGYYLTDTLGKRLFSLSEKHALQNEMRKFLVIEFLKLNMEKQMIALRILYELIKPPRRYTDLEKEEVDEFLRENKIFYQLIQPNVHQQILSRCVELLRYMMDSQIIGWKEIQYIWNSVPHTDVRGRTTIEKLIGDISKDFSIEYVQKIIDKILVVKETEITIDKLNLLKILKDKDLDVEYKAKILTYLWDSITIKSVNIKPNIEEEIQNVFRGFISTLRENGIRIQLLNAMTKRLSEISTIKNEIYLLKYYILTYPMKIEGKMDIEGEKTPQTISQVVEYLKKQKIYETLLVILANVKGKEKIEGILQFINFLFNKDTDDVSLIVKAIYQILGPTDIFLQWSKEIVNRALNFFIELFQNTTGLQKFEKLSLDGFKAIKSMITSINITKGNLKEVIKKKTISQPAAKDKTSVAVETQPTLGPIGPVGQTGNPPVIGPQLPKQEIITFLYVMKSPFQCIGLNFLMELLLFVKGSAVYEAIVKMIIQFIDSLDQSILDKTQQFREEFLSKVISQIENIVKANEFSNFIKLKLEVYVSLICQLFSQTEKNGLSTLSPHFENVEGDVLKLRFEFTFPSTKVKKGEITNVLVNQTLSLWSLKKKLGQIYGQDPAKLDVHRFVNPIEDENNAKTLNQLSFFNEELVKCSKKHPKDLPRVELLTQNNQDLTQKFKAIVQNWFNLVKNDQGLIGKDELKRLSEECWKGSHLYQKLYESLSKGSTSQECYINYQTFKKFFITKSIQNDTAVWRLINIAGYLNNLKRSSQKQPEPDVSIFPRKILSAPKVYDCIFSLLSNKTFQSLHLNFYKLLSWLQTDARIRNTIKTDFKGLLQNQKSIYCLSYIFETIISQIKNDEEFYLSFYQNDGLQEIIKILQKTFEGEESIYKFQTLLKTVVIPNMVKILNMYIYPLLSDIKITRFLKNVKINVVQLDEIIKKTDKIDENLSNEGYQYAQKLKKMQTHVDLKQLYKLIEKIYNNLLKNFVSDFLNKCTNEVIRLYSVLTLTNEEFKYDDLIEGIKSESLNFRKCSQTILYLHLLGANSEKEYKYLIQKMLDGMPQDNKVAYSNYFIFFSKMIEKLLDLTKEEPSSNSYFINLSSSLFQGLFKAQNQQRNSIIANKIILGSLTTINTILEKRPEVAQELVYLKHRLITECLFFYNAKEKLEQIPIAPALLLADAQPEIFENYVKCKTDDSRKILMEVIYQLHKHSVNDQFFSKYITPILNQIPESIRKGGSKINQVGLNNLGSTCYMNAMLQVLNSIQPCRNAIMRTNLQVPLIHELQSLFSYLFFSERVDYIPKNLLTAFVPPINCGIQQDTCEFLNFFFDQIQDPLKNSPYKHVLEQTFKGNQVAQMICHSCGAKRERMEDFFTYGVQIEGKYDLHSALEGMHGGQLISDCLCQACGMKSDTTKRNLLNQVPNVFFIHLKRIVFNYDVFVNTKIHTRLEFPNELNIEPYTKEGVELRQKLGVQYLKKLKENEEEAKKFNELILHNKDKSYYKMKLKAIIVHSGTPEVGHYYTILRKENNWIKLDDSRVSSFSIAGFEDECYGGVWTADEWGGFGSSKNAYVLIYEKELKSDLTIEQPAEMSDESKPTIVQKQVPYKQFTTFNTVEWYKQVWLDNHQFMIETHLTSEHYCKDFINFICKTLELHPCPANIEIISEIFIKIAPSSGQLGNLLDLFNKNAQFITPDTLKKYVFADPKRTFNLLFHNHQKVRDFASEYIEKVLLISYKYATRVSHDSQLVKSIITFIQDYINLVNGQVAKNWLRINGYFRLIYKLVEGSVEFPEFYTGYFIEKHLISYFIDFVMEKASPINIIPKKYSLGTKSNPVNFKSAISLILFLLKKSYGFTGVNNELPKVDESLLFHLSQNDVICLSSMGFYEKMLRENQNIRRLSQIVRILATNNLAFSQAFARVLLRCINEITDPKESMSDFSYCVRQFLTIQDEFYVKRLELVVGYPSPYVFASNTLSSLWEQKFIYSSTLEDLFPIECLLTYVHNNAERNIEGVANLNLAILQSCTVNQAGISYLLRLPAANYTLVTNYNWLDFYFSSFEEALKRVSAGISEEKLPVQKKVFEKILNDIRAELTVLKSYEQSNKIEYKSLIIGKVQAPVLVSKSIDPSNSIQLQIFDVPAYCLPLEYTQSGYTINVSTQKYVKHYTSELDEHLTHSKLQKKVAEGSNVLNIMKQANKPLAVKGKAADEHEDVELTSLFDESPDPTTTDPYVGVDLTQTKPNQLEKQNVKPESKENAKTQEKENAKTVQTPVLPEEIREQINLPSIKIHPDYLRKIQILNLTETTKNVTIKISGGANSYLPTSIKVQVSNKSNEALWLNKENPNLPWGETKFDLLVEQTKEVKNKLSYFKLYGTTQLIQAPKCEMEIQGNQKNTNADKNDENVINNNAQESSEMRDDFDDGCIQCPICTFINSTENKKCEICDNDLHA